MCGIVGVVGLEACSETILDSLKRLEYRGYDSSGIVTQSGGAFQMNRAVGKLRNLSEVCARPLTGSRDLVIRAGPPMAVCRSAMPILTWPATRS